MFDEIDKNNKLKINKEITTTRILVSPANSVDSIVPLENDRNFIAIEEKIEEGELILDSTEQISPILTCMNNLNNETKKLMNEYLKE